MKNYIKVGKLGENIAKDYLIKNKHKIIAQNYLIRKDEIDIVSLDYDGTLVFCEVKTLCHSTQKTSQFMPEDNLNSAKHRKLIRSAQMFAGRCPSLIKEDQGWRIDLIAVMIDEEENVVDIRHYKNI